MRKLPAFLFVVAVLNVGCLIRPHKPSPATTTSTTRRPTTSQPGGVCVVWGTSTTFRFPCPVPTLPPPITTPDGRVVCPGEQTTTVTKPRPPGSC